MVRGQLYNMAFIATSTLLIHQCFLIGNSFASVGISRHLESIIRRYYQPSYLPITSDVDSLSVLYSKPYHLNTGIKSNHRNDNEEDECPDSNSKRPERTNKCCKQQVEECDEDFFTVNDCERSSENAAMTFYTVGGELCRNTVNKTEFLDKCSKFMVVRAVNLNGTEHTDSRGIAYSQDAPGNVVDPDNIKVGRMAVVEVEGYGSTNDRLLYSSLVYANASKLQEGRAACIRYEINLTGDGVHELAVRTVDDTSYGVGQRKFNVWLENVTVFPEVDLYCLTSKKGRAADLILIFEVTNSKRNIILKSFKSKVIEVPQNGKVWLSFCSSNCSNTESRSFIVSSFSVVRFGNNVPYRSVEQIRVKTLNNELREEQPYGGILTGFVEPQEKLLEETAHLRAQCEKENNNPCGCHWLDTCEYNVVSGKCVVRRSECGPVPQNQCRLKGKHNENYYVVGGELCQQVEPTPFPCKPLETMVAFHFSRFVSKPHKSIEGITYHSAKFSGRSEYTNTEYINFEFTNNPNIPKEDVFLHEKHTSSGPGGCVKHLVPITGNGYYEIIIHMLEDHTRPELLAKNFLRGYRADKIVFNSVPIVEAFDFGRYRSFPDGLNFRVNFKVFGLTDYLQMEGYPVSKIENCQKTVYLKYCSTLCKDGWKLGSEYFCIGSFSVNKVGYLPCSDAEDNPCQCKHQKNCEYNEETGECTESVSVVCDERNTDDECRRSGPHIFYAVGGKICPPISATLGNCTIEKVMIGINFGSGAYHHTDIYKISYIPDSLMPPNDPANSKVEDYGYGTLFEWVPEQDRQLYRNYAWGKATNGNMTPCISYNIPTAGDGEYEISIKTGETDRKSVREFSYKLSGQYIVKNFQPGLHAPEPKAMDLNANFRINDGSTKFSLKGHSEVDITASDKSLLFEVCHGTGGCDCDNTKWQISAFSVVKFNRTIQCSYFNNDSCRCRKLGRCQYIVGTGKCVEFDEACSRIFPIGTECRRGGDHIFYAHQGIICHNSVPQGNCKMQKILLAVNFNGGTHTDINGITFQNQQGVRYEDPENVLSLSMDGERFTTEGVPVADLDLYKSYAWGNNTNSSMACVTYYVPTDGDGEYELSFRLVEVWYSGAGLREFLLTFNKQPIVESLDMASVRAVPKGFDMNVNFKVFGNAKGVYTQMRGHAPALITEADKSVRLSFCPGNCHWEGRNWQVAAFSVIKFQGKIIPPLCHEDEIEQTRTVFDYSKFILKKKQH